MKSKRSQEVVLLGFRSSFSAGARLLQPTVRTSLFVHWSSCWMCRCLRQVSNNIRPIFRRLKVEELLFLVFVYFHLFWRVTWCWRDPVINLYNITCHLEVSVRERWWPGSAHFSFTFSTSSSLPFTISSFLELFDKTFKNVKNLERRWTASIEKVKPPSCRLSAALGSKMLTFPCLNL